ncbi:hypothetical protein KJ951_03465 [Patescibacteria group bacterium]|nr:hypothetical protein [Patescibacteria group bacterium]MBU1703437.1 hypothetical protein [Patescibacteria group bacterium]MBU1954010.1 hypothetical protein [Patescibacteria group bacterium]
MTVNSEKIFSPDCSAEKSGREAGFNVTTLAGILAITAAVCGGVGYLLGKVDKRSEHRENSVNIFNIPNGAPVSPKELFVCPGKSLDANRLKGDLLNGGFNDLVYKPESQERPSKTPTEL